MAWSSDDAGSDRSRCSSGPRRPSVEPPNTRSMNPMCAPPPGRIRPKLGPETPSREWTARGAASAACWNPRHGLARPGSNTVVFAERLHLESDRDAVEGRRNPDRVVDEVLGEPALEHHPLVGADAALAAVDRAHREAEELEVGLVRRHLHEAL